ncbi:MAG TPA: hypothetical protein VF541_03025 [Longimicrobium sp.]|jgi:hypothetical protein
MKKLTLDLEALRLESFDVADTEDVQGTVFGADSTVTDGCPNSYPYHCVPQVTSVAAGCA